MVALGNTTLELAGSCDYLSAKIVRSIVKRKKTLGSITLSQEGSDVELKIDSVVAINVAHDLVHFRTTESMSHYIDPVYTEGLPLEAYEDLDSLGEDLTLIGYPGGSFTRIEPRQGISYENILSYTFATELYSLDGASGGPVINSNGHFIGIAFFAEINMVYFIKITHIAKLLSQTSGVRCENDLQSCLLRGARQVAQMAQQGDTLSLYLMGSAHVLVHKIDPNLDRDLNALVDATNKKFPRAEFELAVLFYDYGYYKESLDFLKRSTHQGHPQSIYELGRVYFGEEGMSKLSTVHDKIHQEYLQYRQFAPA